MVEGGNLSPTGYVTAGATTASHLLKSQPRPLNPLRQLSLDSLAKVPTLPAL